MRGISILKQKKKLFISISCILLILIASYATITLLTAHNTLSNTILEKWDGVTVATSFSGGNGTKENPYQISTGEEFAYFKQLIEGETNIDYSDKYYILTKNIDLDNNEFTPIGIQKEDNSLNIFKGEINGNGFSIQNIKITSPQVINNENYYGLFSILNNSKIENLNLVNISIIPEQTNALLNIGTLAGKSYNIEPQVDIISENEKIENTEDKIPAEDNTSPEQTPAEENTSSEETIEQPIASDTKALETKTTSPMIEEKSISNISIINANINLSNVVENSQSKIGGIVGSLTGESKLNNIFISNTFTASSTNIGKLVGELDSTITNITARTNYSTLLLENINDYNTKTESSEITDIYTSTFENNKLLITKDNKNIEVETLVNSLNNTIDAKYNWYQEQDNLKIVQVVIAEENISLQQEQPSLFAFTRALQIDVHNSGVSGNTVYVNDLIADYNYYIGKNYTGELGTSLPTQDKKNLYNDTNLIKVYAKYDGTDLYDSSLTGYVNINEAQSVYIYYKYYAVENGYVTFELIDNPYADRPNNKAFNGWITDYPVATISYDASYYTRSVTIPVTYTNGKPDDIMIGFNASWIDATTAQITSTSTSAWDTAFNTLDAGGMKLLKGTSVEYEDVSGLYLYEGEVGYFSTYPRYYYNESGSYINNTRTYCTNRNGCNYYSQNTDSEYNPDITYYRVVNRTMTVYTPQIIGTTTANELEDGTPAAGYFKTVALSRNTSVAGYYNSAGYYQNSGTCNSSSCTYYELIQYADSSGNLNTVNATDSYFQLVTRDTNIIVLRANQSTSWGSDNRKPFTLTSVNNGSDYRNYYINNSSISVNCYADTRIENIYFYNTESSTTNINSITGNQNQDTYLYGNWNNLKVGRGLRRNGSYVDFISFFGGSNSATGSSTDITKYKLIVESGYYSDGALLNGGTGTRSTVYAEAIGQYGSDYDRVNNDNSTFTITDCLAASWGSYNRASSTSAEVARSIYKSGQYGSRKGSNTAGIYVGQRQGGYSYALRTGKIEGGWFYVINGGPCVDTSNTDENSMVLYVTGGEITILFAGAGQTTTYGNRIVQMTGGKIDYSLFGGSNAYNNTSGAGTIYGSSYLYVGGESVIGDETLVTNRNTLFNSEAGSVFGHGDGGTNSTVVGSNSNSNVIIDGDAHILRNIYGGSNNGLAGSTNDTGSTYVRMKFLNGTLDGNIYGGGNNNGVGSSNVPATITMDILGGTIKGSVFGGTRTKGIVYGTPTVNVNSGTIETDVYGGGEGGYVNSTDSGTFIRDNVTVNIGTTSLSPTINGNVYGGSALGTVNANTYNASANSSKSTIVNVNNGVISGNVFGGAMGNGTVTPYVKGNIVVNINGGNIGQVFGGFDARGTPQGTVNVYLKGGTIGNAFGGGNNTSVNTTNIFLQGSSVSKLFGGSNSSGTVTTSNVDVSSGTVTDIYGGNNIAGTTETSKVNITDSTINGDIYGGGSKAPTTTTNVTIGNVTVKNVYGGGEQANVVTSNVTINGTKALEIYGGSNTLGTVNASNITFNSGEATSLFGGNNEGGSTENTKIDIYNGTIINLFGGSNGEKTSSIESVVNVYNGNFTNIYGGGNSAGLTTSNLNITGGKATNVYGGSNAKGNITTANVKLTPKTTSPINTPTITTSVSASNVTWQSQEYKTIADITVTVTNNKSTAMNDWMAFVTIPDSILYTNYSSTILSELNGAYTFTSQDRYYGSHSLNSGESYTFMFTVLTNASKSSVDATGQASTITSNIEIDSIYGGNNEGGVTTTSQIDIEDGRINNIYGGGNKAVVTNSNVDIKNGLIGNVYGGGNEAEVSRNTNVETLGGTILNNIYGGGNFGRVKGTTNVHLRNTNINGSAYAGGNGSTAIVETDTNITVDGDCIIGTEISKAPNDGSVFGSGNAASTGEQGSTTSDATVNITGSLIYGNVYGGANTSVVYGKTTTNIGTESINDTSLIESNIDIRGTVFGGGESSANSDGTYEGTISVVVGIDININGEGYIPNNHIFAIAGSIFGSGHMSSSSGTSNIYISNLGTKSKPSKNISIQRANDVIIDNSAIELSGATDSTNIFGAIPYSFNRIKKLTITNNTRLLLQENANRLEELYSTVSVSDPTLAAVAINDDTKQVTKNVDNRIYMVANKGGNKNLNITTNEAANEYGRVHGMTFFGLYLSYNNGSFGYGLYDETFNYGTSADAGDEVAGGSYVVGLHATNHDITKDGFYTNYLNDEYTAIKTAYIDPPDKETNYYRWTIGIEIINKTISLTASKFSSLGTDSVSFLEFGNGDTEFNVVGFNAEGLTNGVSLVDSNEVPRLASSEEEANSILGLSMKTETSEWTSYGNTKFLSRNNGSFTGDTHYKTDSQQTNPSLMFYLYHAKNITLAADLGTVIITVQVITPINEIEYHIDMVTITILIRATDIGDGNKYDASIAYDKKYEMPSATSVNITNRSQFTTYYSLYTTADTMDKIYGVGNTYYHVLTSNYALPIGTTITMLDYGKNDTKPEYYYYTVDQSSYNNALTQLATYNEVTYRLSDFIKMGSTSTNNKYSDSASNQVYYKNGQVSEEFIFIFDFKETTADIERQNNTILFELRNTDNFAATTVLDSRQAYMVYNLYKVTNVALQETVNMPEYLYANRTSTVDFTTNVTYDRTENLQPIIDTNYESISMGLNMSLYDSSRNAVSSSSLGGTNLRIDGLNYYTDSDGVYRVKLSGKVSNLTKRIYLTTDDQIPAGHYIIRFTLFASSDGLHNSSNLISTVVDKQVTLIGSNNAIVVNTIDKTKLVDGIEGLNANNTNTNTYTIQYNSVLTNPNLRISIMKRNTDSKDTTTYKEVDTTNLFTNDLTYPSELGLTSSLSEEKILLASIKGQSSTIIFNLNKPITSGTYKIIFKLYDLNQLIEEDAKYIIVRKEL